MPNERSGARAPCAETGAGRRRHVRRPTFGRSRWPGRYTAAVVAVCSISVGFLYWWLSASQDHTIRGENDIPGTLDEAGWMRFWPLRLPAAHFLMPALIRALGSITGDRLAICLVTAVATLVTYLGLTRWNDPDGGPQGRGSLPVAAVPAPWMPSVVTLAVFLFESPAAWVTDTFADVHHWASATDVLALATLVPVVSWTVSMEADRLHQRGRRALPLAALGVIATLAKPSLMLVAWFVVPLWVAYLAARRTRQASAGVAAARCFAPFALATVLTLAWQTWFLRSGQTPFDSGGGWEIHPFWMFSEPAMRSPLVQLVYLGPALAAAGFGAPYRADRYVQLTFWLWIASLGPTLLLQETGAQRLDGNFTVGTRLATFLWIAATLRFAVPRLIAEARSGDARPLGWGPGAARAALGLFVIIGCAAGLTRL